MPPRRKRRGIWRRGAGGCRSNAGMRAASKSKAKDGRKGVINWGYPSMKVFCLLAFASFSAIWAQSAPRAPTAPAAPAMPDLPDDAVVAIFGDGTKFTMGNFRKIFEALPPVNQQMALRNREQ